MNNHVCHSNIREIEDLVAVHRNERERIVFTNGCFDIFHRGHAVFLQKAKAEGDILIVGINTDEGIRRIKGDGRPINTLSDRVFVLCGLRSVDYAVPFSQSTPMDLIRIIKPEVYVKGSDYTEETLPEAQLVRQLGGDVRIVSSEYEGSTSKLIERIIKLGYEKNKSTKEDT